MRRPRLRPAIRRKRRVVSISRLVPNFVTLIGLCVGLSSIRFALDERWHHAVAAILLAGIIDGMDGRLARLLKATSEFGAQLDSLSDFVNFGVAPGLLIYLWSTYELRGFGWAIVLLFAVCCVIRLARFNISILDDDEDERPAWRERFFVGVPSPAGAMLALAPIMIWLEWEMELLREPYVMAAWLTLVAMLMASRLPTYSLKKIVIRHDLALPIMLLAALFIISLVTEPWLTLAAISILYGLSIIVSVLHYKRLYHHVPDTL